MTRFGVLGNDYYEFDGLIRVRSGGACVVIRTQAAGVPGLPERSLIEGLSCLEEE